MIPYPMTTVPGSMPRIILDGVCSKRIIFDADQSDVEQKYQNNSQLPPRAGCLFGADLVYPPADHPSTRLEKLNRSDRKCGQRPGLVEVIAGHSAYARQLGY